ncbi:hypothetical protein FIV42_05540 [Persicimonas caeni]|uniref:Uncharacterized protein n=1 Tax=Persicimonas caeni TaxID=2292766 RepID=A0A4Y6PQ24_PERCE|nr:hypothetical protein [Persicimonas caeni]QDG50209.1 hypothetical protein FIV42_05540 [Persicimonas caeni]QED31430.1 hypothetical protein FRD00_05535 [Persicimonas caeni]
MKVDIRDKETFQSLTPLEVVSYLRASGWTQVETIGEQAAIWTSALDSGQEVELLVPLDRNLRDYALRTADLFQSLARAEGRSQLALLRDVQSSAVDTVRVRLFTDNGSTDSIRFDDAVAAVANTRAMMLAAACSAVEPREYYHARKFDQSIEYVRRLKMGQTEPGSFILTVLSRVPPVLRTQPALFEDGATTEEPFERQVTRTLMSGLQSARSAAQRAMATGDIDPFNRAVSSGVSANLCDALLGLAGTDADAPFEVRLTWASNRKAPQGVPTTVSMSPDVLPVFEEVSRVFKEKSPREEFELEGVVIRLHREQSSGPGTVTVMGAVEGKSRKVAVALSEDDFAAAIRAFEHRTPVRVLGELDRSGRGFQLNSPRHFELSPEE